MSTLFRFVYSFIFLLFIISKNASAQSKGCTDINAINYTSGATQNDGSCQYRFKKYYPKKLTNLPKEINETSGLIFWNNALWTINDGGNPAALYKVDSSTGYILSKVNIHNTINKDWEGLTQCDSFIYIGDFGNNLGNRKDLCVYRISKAELSSNTTQTVNASVIHFHYTDQQDFTDKNRNTEWDAEAFYFHNDSLNIITKNWVTGGSVVYRISNQPGNYTAKSVDTIWTGGLVTDVAFDANNGNIILLGYTKSYKGFALLLFDYPEGKISKGNKRRIDFGNTLGVGQIEGICFTDKHSGFISAEAIIVPRLKVNKPAKLHRFNFEPFFVPQKD